MPAAPSAAPISIVVPAYNEEARLEPTLREIGEFLAERGRPFEILVVDDGSRDGTVDIARAVAARDTRVRVLALGENAGKGAAVRRGMLEATGDLVLFSDADLATPIEELDKLERAIAGGADIAIGSRAVEGADIHVRQHPLRELMGRSFNLMVRLAGVARIRDTQCGFKLFTRRAARDLFGRATVDGFAFDVEVLVLARGRYRVVEVPVAWRHVEESKVSPGSDAARMLYDLVGIRVRELWRRLPARGRAEADQAPAGGSRSGGSRSGGSRSGGSRSGGSRSGGSRSGGSRSGGPRSGGSRSGFGGPRS